MKELNRKTPLVFKIGVLLLCAMLVTSYMMSGLYARYTVTAFASDSARVAKFTFTDGQMQMQAQSFVIYSSSVYPGQIVGSYQVAIENKSEVAISYVIKFENLTDNLPVKDVTRPPDVLVPNQTTSIIFQIPWLSTDNSPDYAGKTDIVRITVSVEQVD